MGIKEVVSKCAATQFRWAISRHKSANLPTILSKSCSLKQKNTEIRAKLSLGQASDLVS